MLITVDMLAARREKQPDLLVVDVRSPAEYADDGHIAGSVNIPLAALLEHTAQLAGVDQVVMVCARGQRSASAAQVLQAAAGIRADTVSGGCSAWCAAGYPVVMG